MIYTKCKKIGCQNEASLRFDYCSPECAPLGFWRLWEEQSIEDIAPEEPKQPVKNIPEHYEDPTVEWEEREEYFEWNSRD